MIELPIIIPVFFGYLFLFVFLCFGAFVFGVECMRRISTRFILNHPAIPDPLTVGFLCAISVFFAQLTYFEIIVWV